MEQEPAAPLWGFSSARKSDQAGQQGNIVQRPDKGRRGECFYQLLRHRPTVSHLPFCPSTELTHTGRSPTQLEFKKGRLEMTNTPTVPLPESPEKNTDWVSVPGRPSGLTSPQLSPSEDGVCTQQRTAIQVKASLTQSSMKGIQTSVSKTCARVWNGGHAVDQWFSLHCAPGAPGALPSRTWNLHPSLLWLPRSAQTKADSSGRDGMTRANQHRLKLDAARGGLLHCSSHALESSKGMVCVSETERDSAFLTSSQLRWWLLQGSKACLTVRCGPQDQDGNDGDGRGVKEAATELLGSLLGTETLRPHPGLLNENLHFNKTLSLGGTSGTGISKFFPLLGQTLAEEPLQLETHPAVS
ncbi:hypothetical protein Cadr_000027928 [Camelus dromedarius]|uniref:Uncharacterized protein n=1 Tax=Camelus dromedarius TaxID=9838 RepID=A0A5N4C9P3_CAMDR|nr:hypothetical protein Cadr_000027928 [Camelus dromedarius]